MNQNSTSPPFSPGVAGLAQLRGRELTLLGDRGLVTKLGQDQGPGPGDRGRPNYSK